MVFFSSKFQILQFSYKAYLLAPEASEEETEEYAKKLTFSFGDPDGHQSDRVVLSDLLAIDDENAPVFNLMGRKVAEGKSQEKQLRQGIYVKKGKKFIVK